MRLKGMPISFHSMAWDSAAEYVRDKPDLMVIEAMDGSGYPEIVTKEYAKRLSELIESCKPKGDFKFNSKILVFGTGGTIEDNKDWEDIFKNND